jgi:surface protein
MFAGLLMLKNIEHLDYLNTENVTNMKYMFWSCKTLTMLDVSNFNVSNVTDMGQMFACCSRLKTIYCAPDANWSNEHYKSMFTGCDLLSGKCRGMEFKYIDTNVHTEDGYYARVYTGDDEVGGYFTSIAERQGDINDDGEVNSGDVMAIYSVMAGNGTPEMQARADVNGDGHVDSGDIMAIYNIMAGN